MVVRAADREGRRPTLSVRLTPEGRAKLEQAASANGRSLAQEVEMRLEHSFSEEGLLDQMFGGNKHSRNLIEAASTAIRRIELVRNARWVDDYGTLWACRRALEHVQGIVLGYEVAEPQHSEDPGENKKFQNYLSQLAHSAATEACRDLGLIAPAPAKNVSQHVVASQRDEGGQKKKQKK